MDELQYVPTKAEELVQQVWRGVRWNNADLVRDAIADGCDVLATLELSFYNPNIVRGIVPHARFSHLELLRSLLYLDKVFHGLISSKIASLTMLKVIADHENK